MWVLVWGSAALAATPMSWEPQCRERFELRQESDVCECLRAPADSRWWIGGLGPEYEIAGTCWEYSKIMDRSLRDPNLEPPLIERGTFLASLRDYVVKDSRLVSQDDVDQIMPPWMIRGLQKEWLIYDQWGDRLATLDFGDQWVPTEASLLDLNLDQIPDLMIALASGELWVVYGPVDPNQWYGPPADIK